MEIRQIVLLKYLEALFSEHWHILQMLHILCSGLLAFEYAFLGQTCCLLVLEHPTPRAFIWPLQKLEILVVALYIRCEERLEKLLDHRDELVYEGRYCSTYAERRHNQMLVAIAESRTESFRRGEILPALRQVSLVQTMISVLQSLPDCCSSAGLQGKWKESWLREHSLLINN